MKILHLVLKQKNKLLQFIHLQLFLTLISLPILLCWGLPISLLSFAGNLLFAPILTIFLLLSSLIFFFQILHLPNGLLIFCLEKITFAWISLMQYADQKVLIGFKKPHVILVLITIVSTLAILHYKKNNSIRAGIASYSMLLLCIVIYLKFDATPASQLEEIDCNQKKVTIIYTEKKITVIDPGVIGRRISARSWLEYTLMPHLVKQYGITTIHNFIILQPNKTIFDALHSLLEKITIENVYIISWQGKIPLHWWISFAKLQDTCKNKKSNLIRIGKKIITINPNTITINPLAQIISMQDFSYPCLQVRGSIDNKNVDVYSAKYNN